MESTKLGWENIWDSALYVGPKVPPRNRRGHSMNVIKSQFDTDKTKAGSTYLVIFGGRDNPQKAKHIPTTYHVENDPETGQLVFITYTDRPVDKCHDTNPDERFYTLAERADCDYWQNRTTKEDLGVVDVDLIYNDIWAYELCNASLGERDWDGPCKETGWVAWHSGAPEGGCIVIFGSTECSVPSERYNHASAYFDDGTLFIYGGFSKRCGDYCDDLWYFDIYKSSWRARYAATALTYFYTDIYDEETILMPLEWRAKNGDGSMSDFAGPAMRWRHTMVTSMPFPNPEDPSKRQQNFALFGGYCLWHGYTGDNSEENNWGSYRTKGPCGYKDDLWLYTKDLDDLTVPGLTFKTAEGKWQKLEATETCVTIEGSTYETRITTVCTTVRPPGRAGHGSVYDDTNMRVFIFGGFNTYFPYLSTDGIGSGLGTVANGGNGFIPYPSFPYYMNDMWYYDLRERQWTEIIYPAGSLVPDKRADMVFLAIGQNHDMFFLHGGFSDNFIYDDTWYFNVTAGRWVVKESFVWPEYPQTCTDDFKYIEENNCKKLQWPKHLLREEEYPYDILDLSEQPYRFSYNISSDDEKADFAVFDKSFKDLTSDEQLELIKGRVSGTPQFPFAATGTDQYVETYILDINGTEYNISLWCTSAFGVPTRGRLIDGEFGRANEDVYIAQARPMKPGWDGCTARADGRADLTQSLQYKMPYARYNHRGVYVKDTDEIFVFGGQAYTAFQSKAWRLGNTPESVVDPDMWVYNLGHCVNNCSNAGNCENGFCICHEGYWGSDCSNMSCPGTYCYYDDVQRTEECRHACQGGYEHTDQDTYVQDIAKVGCSYHNLGIENGICNGYGVSQCAPPFVGEDCSIKDCKDMCSFNGFCSIEYPVSRCQCHPGYFGDTCDKIICLNNCSYPNGLCDTNTGNCTCRMMYSPYENWRPFKAWGGEDCSYMHPYAAGPQLATRVFRSIASLSQSLVLWSCLVATVLWTVYT